MIIDWLISMAGIARTKWLEDAWGFVGDCSRRLEHGRGEHLWPPGTTRITVQLYTIKLFVRLRSTAVF